MHVSFAKMQEQHPDEPLRWDDLRAFLAVARSGTLSRASRDLGVNASTLHRRIAALEPALGAELFEKQQRGYRLTAVGEALLPHALEVEEAVQALRRQASGHDRTASGPVTLTLPETLVEIVVPCLARVRAQCPGLRPVLKVDDRLLDLGRDADVALRPSSTPPGDVVGRKVGVVAWAVYARSDASVDARWVVYARGDGPRRATQWRRSEHSDAAALMEVSSVGAMHRALQATAACGLLPAYLGDVDPRLERRSALIEQAETELWLLIHADLRRSARVRALVDLITPGLIEAAPLLAGAGVG